MSAFDKVVYVAGPFRAACGWDIEQHVRRAEALALEIWRAGFTALCPHTNTRFFHAAAPDSTWLEGDLEMLRRCDAVLMVPGWEQSKGATREREEALKHGIPVFYSLEELKAFDWELHPWELRRVRVGRVSKADLG